MTDPTPRAAARPPGGPGDGKPIRRALGAGLLGIVLLTGCAGNGSVPGSVTATTATATTATTTTGGGVATTTQPAAFEVWRPAPGTTWQWQLTGEIDLSHDVDMYDLDLFDVPEETIERLHDEGRVVVCYFSAGAWEAWRPDAGDFPGGTLGEDNGWPDERWLDIRRIDVLGPILEARLDLAAAKGCDGVEPDNVDGYANASGFPLSAADQLVFNRWLADAAHRRGLSVGLKNDLEQIPDLVGDFDWALNEQCFEFDECEALLPFIEAGKAVFGVEYEGTPPDFCPEALLLGYSWLLKDLDLGSWVQSC